MTDLSKIDVRKARHAQSGQDRLSARLERADLSRACHEPTLHDQLGQRLRRVFPAPETNGDSFESLLKRISAILP